MMLPLYHHTLVWDSHEVAVHQPKHMSTVQFLLQPLLL